MRTLCLLAGGLALAMLPAALHGAPGDPAADNAAPVAARAPTTGAPAQPTAVTCPNRALRGRSAQWAYVDPKTGRLTDRPPTGAPPMKPQGAEAVAAAGASRVLEAMPGLTAAGGIVARLDDRFTTYLVATVGKDGKTKLRHEPAPRNARATE